MAEYASNAKGNAALTTGIIGTTLGGIAAAGGLGAILGIRPGGPPMEPGDRPVTRYELGLIQQNNELRDENTLLKSRGYTDGVAAGLQRQIDGQVTVTAVLTANQQAQQAQLMQLYSMTRLYIPNANVSPGWGPANVSPAPPPLYQLVQTPGTVPPTDAAATTTTTTTGG